MQSNKIYKCSPTLAFNFCLFPTVLGGGTYKGDSPMSELNFNMAFKILENKLARQGI